MFLILLAGLLSHDAEKELVSRSKKNDSKAMEELILNYQDRIYSFILRLVSDADDAEDIAQDVFVKFFNTLQGFKGECSVKSWLFKIASNEVKNFWKSRAVKKSRKTQSLFVQSPDTAEEEELPIPSQAKSPREAATETELAARLNSAMLALPVEFKEALLLRFQEQLSYEEIAAALEINIGTVKSRLARAREELKKLMEPYL